VDIVRFKITEVAEAKIKVTIKKTGKSYYRTMNYAKHVIISALRQPKEKAVHEYFLLMGNRRWKKVTEKEYKKATSKKAVEKLHEELEKELRQRVERIMA